MIGDIIHILQIDPFYKENETIEIAKGKHKLAEDFKEVFEQVKRK